MYSVHWGAHVVNGDTFQFQTFNSKYARDLPMTHASIAIQHFTILAFIRDPKGASCVVCMLSMVVVREGRNLLLLWLGHVGLWYLWQQQDTDLKARMLYGWLNGMRGIRSTKQIMLINEPCNDTAAAPTGWHGHTVSI
ncbi:hypothetical protein O0I10_005357 [Lichtheimia ornata]|uniref:Uncharacterized protein n=1 Tax=Lichtheimia ornata TaxID=688661 RepID=A0AAD7V538_9FUNG|nr:uncharacterized protein O0I10_005357 [Lichtheimia ornata]KAJ8658975.1 hypothetical protein O0I10_005357 [Lichtheimia ornata]